MRFDLKDEAIAEYLKNIENYSVELQNNNLNLQKQLKEVLSQTQYELLQKLIDEIVRNYNENVVDASKGILGQWCESEISLKAIMHHYRVGEQAEKTCSDLDKMVIEKISQNLNMISLEYESPKRPKVSKEDFERVEQLFQQYEKKSEEIYYAFISKIRELTKENEIYLCFPTLVNLLQKKNVDFVEFAQARIGKLEAHIEKELSTFIDDEESKNSILRESFDNNGKAENSNSKAKKVGKFIDKLCSFCKEKVPNAIKKVWDWIKTHPEERKEILQLLSALLNSPGLQSVSEGTKLMNKLIKIFAGENEDEVKDDVDLKTIDAGMSILKKLGLGDNFFANPAETQEYINKISPGIQKVVAETLKKPEYRVIFYPNEDDVIASSLKSHPKVNFNTYDTKNLKDNKQKNNVHSILGGTEKIGEVNKIENNDSVELEGIRRFINRINTLDTRQNLDPKLNTEIESLKSCLGILRKKGLDKLDLNSFVDANNLKKVCPIYETKYDDTYLYDYDFNSYSPDELKQLSPRINFEEVEKISNEVGDMFTGLEYINGLQEEIDDLIKKNEDFVKIHDHSILGEMIRKINQVSREMVNPILIREENGEYDRCDVELLLQELDQIANKDEGMKNFNKGVSNFMRRKMGYPAIDSNGRNIVKKLHELIPSLDKNSEEFVVQNPKICDMIFSAKKIKDDDCRRKGICEGLRKNKGILNFMGITLVFTLLGSGGAIAAICMLLFGSMFINDDTDKDYSELVLNLGEDRTDNLLNNYSYDGKRFIRN